MKLKSLTLKKAKVCAKTAVLFSFKEEKKLSFRDHSSVESRFCYFPN